MTDNVNNPKHYQGENGMEVIDVIRDFIGKDNVKYVYLANIIKYVLRYPKKNGLEDLQKARVYLDWLIDSESDGESNKNNFDDLITKIVQWAKDRNLDQADPKIQWMRITEEVGEIRDVLLKPTKFVEPDLAMKDAIGDSLVTIIVLTVQLNLDVTECLQKAYDEIKDRKGVMIGGTFVKEEDLRHD